MFSMNNFGTDFKNIQVLQLQTEFPIHQQINLSVADFKPVSYSIFSLLRSTCLYSSPKTISYLLGLST